MCPRPFCPGRRRRNLVAAAAHRHGVTDEEAHVLDTFLTAAGNVVETPLRRVTTAGTTVSQFRLATSSRYQDRASGQWRDGATVYLRVVCWRNLADNVAASLRRGDRVLVSGRLRQHSYEVDGQKRLGTELEAESVAADLTWAEVSIRPATRSRPAPGLTSPGADPAGEAAAGTGEPGEDAGEEDTGEIAGEELDDPLVTGAAGGWRGP